MRYIFLSLFTLLLLTACGENPTQTLSYPQISDDEAIALVHENLQSIQTPGDGNCLHTLKSKVEEYLGHEPSRAFLPMAFQQVDGSWEVSWSVPVNSYQVSGTDLFTIRSYQWMVYPTTRTVMRTDNSADIPGVSVCP